MAKRKKPMKSWHKEKKDLEEAIGIAGVAAAYNLIPKDMPVREFPKRLAIYHQEQLTKEMLEEIPSSAEIARKARLDELRRGK